MTEAQIAMRKPRRRYFTVTIIQIGKGLGFVLPPRLVKESGLKEGDRVKLTIEFRKKSAFGIARGSGPFDPERDGHPDSRRSKAGM